MIVTVRVVCASNLAELGELGAVLGDSSEQARKKPSGEDLSDVKTRALPPGEDFSIVSYRDQRREKTLRGSVLGTQRRETIFPWSQHVSWRAQGGSWKVGEVMSRRQDAS